MAKASVHKVDPAKHRKAEFLFPENIKNFEQLPMEFAVSHPTDPLVLLVSTPFPPHPPPQGYCACSLALHGGLVVPAAPEVGVLHHKGRYFVFSSSQAADVFASDPER